MRQRALDGFIVPHAYRHQNEYLAPSEERLAWLTRFSGSAGVALILADRAVLFVDGRYQLQVREQVDQGLFEILDITEGGVPAYLEATPKAGAVIGYDPRLHSPDALFWLRTAAQKAGARLEPGGGRRARHRGSMAVPAGRVGARSGLDTAVRVVRR